MADKTIGSLPQAQSVDDSSLFVCEQQGVAMKTTGAQWKGFAVQSVSQYVEPAQQAAQQAQQAAQQAQDAVSQIGTAVEDTQANAQAAQEAKEAAETAQGKAEDAQEAIENLSVSAETLPPDQEATVEKTVSPDGVVSLAFGIPQGNPGETPDIEIGTVDTLEPGQDATADITGTTPNLTLSLGIPKGQPGTSVSRIQRTSGTGAPGTTDTYTMYDSNDDAIGTFTVYNGANGAGAGDMMADGSVPMTGPLNMGGNKITNLGAPGADTDAVRKSDLDAVADEVDGILDGTTPVHLSPATDTKIGGVIIGEGLSVEADGTVSADDQLPAGGTQGQVLTQGTTGPEWTNAPDPLPTGGETGQVLTKTANGTAWDDVPSDFPSGGTDGQILTKTADGVAWEDAPEGGVTSFKGRTGAVTPQDGDYTADMVGARPDTWTPSAADVGAVPTSRTVNGKALSSNITLTAADVNAASPPTSTTVTLTTSGWSSNTQTVTVSGVSADETAQLIMPVPALASQTAYYEAGILVTGQAANSLTFTCQTVPTADLTVYVVMQEVGA